MGLMPDEIYDQIVEMYIEQCGVAGEIDKEELTRLIRWCEAQVVGYAMLELFVEGQIVIDKIEDKDYGEVLFKKHPDEEDSELVDLGTEILKDMFKKDE